MEKEIFTWLLWLESLHHYYLYVRELYFGSFSIRYFLIVLFFFLYNFSHLWFCLFTAGHQNIFKNRFLCLRRIFYSIDCFLFDAILHYNYIDGPICDAQRNLFIEISKYGHCDRNWYEQYFGFRCHKVFLQSRELVWFTDHDGCLLRDRSDWVFKNTELFWKANTNNKTIFFL